MKKLIKLMVEQVMDELVDPQEPTVYFDMDGVLADFQGGIENDAYYTDMQQKFTKLASKHKPELLKYHTDDLKNVFKGRQEDPVMALLKKVWNKRRSALYTAAGGLGHFRNLKLLPGAREMMQAAIRLAGKKPHILTAPMKSAPKCEEEKREWVDEHVGGLFDKFYCTQDKHLFAKSKWDILIDDRPKYVNKFREAGGTAIMHTEASKTIAELGEFIANLVDMNEVNAIGVGGAALASSGHVSATSAGSGWIDHEDEHEMMWSDPPRKKTKK